MNGLPGITQALSSSPDFLKDFQHSIVQIISAYSILPGTCPKYMIQSQVHIEFQASSNSLEKQVMFKKQTNKQKHCVMILPKILQSIQDT